MARPLRVWVPGGWYHVTSRGNRREAIYRTDDDRRRFLGLVAELPERFGVEVHAFVLMDNHYHLVVRTPEPTLSDAMRWLHVTYTSRYNLAHRQCGHVFQGRFQAYVIQDLHGVVEVARYVHLNPIRVGRSGLGKAQVRRARLGAGENPGASLVKQRLRELRDYRWSSWRVYAGTESKPGWLETEEMAKACGGRSRPERREALREYTEGPVREGHLTSPWERLLGGLVLGEEEFARNLLKRGTSRKPDEKEQTSARQLGRRRKGWAEVVKAAEQELGRTWQEIAETWGDWGRDGTIYVAVRHGRVRLSEVVKAAGGLSYGSGAQAVRRFEQGLGKDRKKQRFVQALRRRIH